MQAIDLVRRTADHSIRKGCGFGMLAIATTTIGLAGDLVLATRCAAILVSLMAAILYVMGATAPKRNYKSTEVWALLRDLPGVPPERRQQFVGSVLEERFHWHARMSAYSAAALWAVALIVWAVA